MSFTDSPRKGSTPTKDVMEHRASLYASDLVRRVSQRDSMLPLCMSRAQQEARRQSSTMASNSKRRHRRSSSSLRRASSCGVPVVTPTSTGWSALLSLVEASTEVGRAVQMCSFYPSMRICGTAFENSLNLAHRQSSHLLNGSFSSLMHPRAGGGDSGSIVFLPDDPIHSPMRSPLAALESSAGAQREMLEESRSGLEMSQSDLLVACSGITTAYGTGRTSIAAAAAAADAAARTLAFSGASSMVQVACAMKRASMWEIVVVTVLYHRIVELRFRRQRLRRVLERHLLPTLLSRKRRTGSVVVKSSRSKGSGSADDRPDAPSNRPGDLPEGTYLRDHNTFFDSLHSASLLQSFAEKMTRKRYLPGDIIARAGDFSQRSMHFLISGKCEVCTERWRQEGDIPEPADEFTTARGGARHQQWRNGGVVGPELLKEVITAGTSIGGVFGGNAQFLSTYRALSQCIVWMLRTEDFEQIFGKFADRVMLDKYKEAIRHHSLWWLQQRYSPSTCYSSIPIYRKLTRRMPNYLSDFSPVVKTRGEKLFSEGDVAGDIYCLLEGTVLRRAKGATGTYGDDSVMQRLGTNSLTALNVPGRYLMFGEEPHLVPGVQPYTCIVSSRVALFYKVEGEQFVGALLDDPQLYAQLREQLMQQRQNNMRLHPECLSYLPLLQRFPVEKREELVQHARPRVIGRSVSVCDPGQHLSELIIVVRGTVRDARNYSHKPTAPLEVPASCEVENGEGTPGESGAARALATGGGAKAHGKNNFPPLRNHTGASPSSKQKASQGNFLAFSTAGSTSQRLHDGARDSVVERHSIVSGPLPPAAGGALETAESDGIEWDFSFNNVETLPSQDGAPPSENVIGLKGAGFVCAASGQQLLDSAPLTYPVEAEEINPPLPAQPARRFVSTLGGSWEALLLEKWPNGWESLSTVEMWVIPTAKIRLVYNSCPKPVQLSILSGLRHAQKEDLRLPTLPLTKLPPMSIYSQHGEPVVTVSISPAKSGSAPATNNNRQRSAARRVASPPRAGESVLIGAEERAMVGSGKKYPTAPNNADLPKVSTSSVAPKPSMDGSRKKVRLLVPIASSQVADDVALPPSKEGISQPSRSAVDSAQAVSPHERKPQTTTAHWLAKEDHARTLRRLRKATSSRAQKPVATTPSVSAALLECYEGVPGAADPLMLRIVRDPVAVAPEQSGARSGKQVHGSTALQESLLVASSGESSAVAWPTLTPARDRWFQVVPSYEPLPGTVSALQTLASPPAFAPSSIVLSSACISSPHRHTKMLENHVAYYSASLSHPSCRPAFGESAAIGTPVSAAAATPGPISVHTRAPLELDVHRGVLPKRWAYAS